MEPKGYYSLTEETTMYNKKDEKCYEDIVYDLNELSRLIGKAGEKYFDRIIENLDKLVCKSPDVKRTSTKK